MVGPKPISLPGKRAQGEMFLLIAAVMIAAGLILGLVVAFLLSPSEPQSPPKSTAPPAQQAIPQQPALSTQSSGLSCDEYCGKVQSACASGSSNAQFAKELDCLVYCEKSGKFPIGKRGDTTGNSLGCRTYHAEVAGKTGADIHCPHAGPSGGDVCGSYCDNYCHLALKNCGSTLYSSAQSCQDACKSIASQGNPGDTSGDSIQCRIYHLGVAGSDLPASGTIHCPHGAVDGGGVCVGPLPGQKTLSSGQTLAPSSPSTPSVPTCESYCETIQSACVGNNVQYASRQDCLSSCQGFTKGALSDKVGDTLGCRQYHAGVAKQVDAALHCPHAGRSGGGVCATQSSSSQSTTTTSPAKPARSSTQTVQIAITQFRFAPPLVEIPVGSTVVWTNLDDEPHSVVSQDGELSSSVLAKGETYTHVFNRVGSFPYICGVHPSMKGSVVVK